MNLHSKLLAIGLSLGLVSGTAVAQDPPRFTADRAPRVPAQEPAGAGQATEVNTGQDPTRPLTRPTCGSSTRTCRATSRAGS